MVGKLPSGLKSFGKYPCMGNLAALGMNDTPYNLRIVVTL